MKKIVKTMALIAVLGMGTTGCQKESVFSSYSAEENISENITMLYSVDGEGYSITLNSEEEMDAFFLYLTALARQGHSVVVANENARERTISSKEVVTYTTTDANDAARWAKKMTQEGYAVTIHHDSQTGVYTCIAVK